jgi:chromatin assembly factor 1 subunit A
MSGPESPRSLKRDHDAFEEIPELEEPCSVPPYFLQTLEAEERKPETLSATESLPTPPVSIGNKRDASPARSTTGSLTDAGTDTPSGRGQSPMVQVVIEPMGSGQAGEPPATASAFAALNGSAPPPPKKAKLTFQEREMKRINKEIKERERAEERARKEAEKQANAEEKARKDAEKEAERKRKEAEKEEKRAAQEAEKAAKEEKKRQKEEEKRQKEEQKRKTEEAKKKKEGSQMKLGNFFALPKNTDKGRRNSVDSKERTSMSPAPSNPNIVATPAASTPRKPQLTLYEKLFPEFFIQNNVTVAPTTRFERDDEASETVQSTIDSYILGNRSPGKKRTFDAASLFHMSPHKMAPRGRRCMPVREIMDELSGNGNSSRPIDLTTDSQNSQIKRTTDLLKKVPMKFLKFQEDVRPPYRGTYTSRPVSGMTKLARNPLRRDLPDTNYDYDSEAEWVEDEDAEDLKSEGDEEEELDDDEDMDGFLDDENDETANSRRLVLQGDLEPVSTGLCWEDRKKRNTNVKMVAYRMEMILGMLNFPFLISSLLSLMHGANDGFGRPDIEINRPLFLLILGTSTQNHGSTSYSSQRHESPKHQQQQPRPEICQAILHAVDVRPKLPTNILPRSPRSSLLHSPGLLNRSVRFGK